MDHAADTSGISPADRSSKESLPASTCTAPSTDAATVFKKLDSRSVGLSRLVAAISFAVIGVAILIGGFAVLIFAPFPWKVLVPFVWAALAAVSCCYTYWWPQWEHDRWSYRVADNIVELHNGVVWHRTVAIPISRLQHVDLHRGPLQKRWGLASLQIHTAGTRDASHEIPGLDVEVAAALRDQLIEAANGNTDE